MHEDCQLVFMEILQRVRYAAKNIRKLRWLAIVIKGSDENKGKAGQIDNQRESFHKPSALEIMADQIKTAVAQHRFLMIHSKNNASLQQYMMNKCLLTIIRDRLRPYC